MATISRVIAFIIVSVALTFLLHVFDEQRRAELSVPPAALIMNEEQDLQWGYVPDIIGAFVFGPIYLGTLELVAWVVRKILGHYFISN